MVADADLQVWLDMQAHTGQAIVVPYVKSARDRHVRYRIDIVQRSGGNGSRISQQGELDLSANRQTALAGVAIGTGPREQCQIDLVLKEEGETPSSYRFDCPR